MGTSTLTNPIAEADAGSPLPEASRFACLPSCGLCCSYRVLVTDRDRKRLEAAATAAGPWEEGADGRLALRRTPDFCLFLDSRWRCGVYAHRPAHCNTYPYLLTGHDGLGFDVDLSCPGLGRGEEFQAHELNAPTRSDEFQAHRAGAFKQIRGLLVAQRRFAARKWLHELGEGYIEGLNTAWNDLAPAGGWTLHVEQRKPVLVNVETEAALEELRQGLQSSRKSTRGLLDDAAWLERHFAKPRWNTRLHPTGELDVYRFWIARRELYSAERGGARSVTPVTDIDQIPWEDQALASRNAYLRRWLNRELLRRLATNLSLAAFIPGSHLAVTYLHLLLDIDHRLAVLAPALALAQGRDVVDCTLALEAVRGSDGLLRAWCESARLGITD